MALFEEPNLAAANVARVPRLMASAATLSGKREKRPDPILLATATVCVDPSAATLGAGGAREMEVTLKGRRLLGKDYKVRFQFDISIW